MNKNTIITTVISVAISVALFSLLGFGPRAGSPQDQKILSSTPIGSIMIWPGSADNIPTGWKVCNGDLLNQSKYSDLFEEIQTYWNTDIGDAEKFFRVPDLRGVFLRGVNGSRNDQFSDPEKDSRERLFSASTVSPNESGSYQMDAFQNHTVPYGKGSADSSNGSVKRPGGGVKEKLVDNGAGNPRVASETRGRNAYVHFIIYTGVTE